MGGDMKYRKFGKLDIEISVISMGGHEYLPSGASRGFNENFELAIRPDYIFDGFGQESRKEVLAAAFDNGINFFDVTMDSEKEALGRNLRDMPPPYPIYVQTRPEGMGYTYDENNVKLARYSTLKSEVERILKLMKRDCIEFLNIPFMQSALDNDAEYLAKIGDNIRALKQEGLILHACADTFSGEHTYLEQLRAGCFDAVYINFSFGDCRCLDKVFPRAADNGLGIIGREAFMKGKLFKMADEAGCTDKTGLARAALKWCLARDDLTTVIYGTGKAKNLISAARAVDDLQLTEEEMALIARIRATKMFRDFETQKSREFVGARLGVS
jgi:aryl-alcohol dehydrogenase-like predicted oxidoreductase